MDPIIQTLLNVAPWAIGYIVIILVMFFAFRFYYTRFRKIEEKTTHAKCERHHEDITTAKVNVDRIFVTLSNIENAIISISPKTASMFSKANSPVQLNSLGRQLFEESGASLVLQQNRDQWIIELEQLELKTALDVEERSRLFLIGLLNTDIFTPIKDYVYNHPTINDVSISMIDIAYIVGLELRNAYLEHHPELVPEA